jgi:septum formation protein
VSAINDTLILASGSPRRRELLAEMGIHFEVITADVIEHDALSAPHLTPAALACENAHQKAEAVAKLHRGRVVLGADTVVALDKSIFGKPCSLEEAVKFLATLSGQTHEVITGCALLTPDSVPEIFHEITKVTFRPLTEEIIARYLAVVHVLDKAGAYALQEQGDWIIERVEGSRSNVIGLPTELLTRVFRRRGLL